MGMFRRLKNSLCCVSNKYLLDDDDDDDDATIVDQDEPQFNGSLQRQQEVSEKQPLLSSFEQGENTRFYQTVPQQNQVVVKSVLRRKRSMTVVNAANAPRRRYNILLFGDSLTAGWCEGGYGTYHPYGLRLQKRFDEEGLDVEVTVSGVPGECCVHMEERLKRELEQPGKWYDWIVIMGGTNDVFQGYSAWDIFDGLKKLYTLSSKHGARILGITIPEYDWDAVNHLDYQRRIVNEHLNVYNNSTTRNAYTLFLLDRFLPMNCLTEEQRKVFWDSDGIHPTEDGYDLMGDMIFDILFKEGSWD
ncbi:hypothetical protein G9A89_012963 [Geosiphon pyriformis]|nr:hypothetical protein G9A89_012963 [Geosiphon pyriformis]